MVRLIVLFPLVYLSLVQCHSHKRNGHNRHHRYGFNQYWQPNRWLPKHFNPRLYPEWNPEPGFEDFPEEFPANRQPVPVNQRPNYGYEHPQQNFPRLYPEWNPEPGFEDFSEEILPNRQPIPVNQRPNYGYGHPQQNFPHNRRTNKPPVQNEPNDMLQSLVDEVVAVDKKIKNICNRGHHPSEEYTEDYYKRMFNVEGYITETATVRIKHTVLYSCLDPVLRGRPCLQDVALLPENLNVKEAVYNIVNNNLTVKIPFKKDSMFMGGDICRVGDMDEKVIIVSKEAAVDDYGHIIDLRNAVRKNIDSESAFVYPSD